MTIIKRLTQAAAIAAVLILTGSASTSSLTYATDAAASRFVSSTGQAATLEFINFTGIPAPDSGSSPVVVTRQGTVSAPEPSTFSMALGGLLLCIGGFWRKKSGRS